MIRAFALALHLAGAAPYYSGEVFASREACERAGQAWLERVRERSANDWFECIPRRDR